MPHVFKVVPYRKLVVARKAEVGDLVYLKAQPNLSMWVFKTPDYNEATGFIGKVSCRWLSDDLRVENADFFVDELSS